MYSVLLGLCCWVAGQADMANYPETREFLSRALAPTRPLESYLTAGEFYFKRAQYDHAKQIFAYGLTYAPFDARFLGWLALTESKLKRTAEARQYAEAALDIDASNTMARQVLESLGGQPQPAASAPAAEQRTGNTGAGASPEPEASPAAGTGSGSKGSGPGTAVPMGFDSLPPSPGKEAAPLYEAGSGSAGASAAPPRPTKGPAPTDVAVLARLLDLSDPKQLAGIGSPGEKMDPDAPGDQRAALGVLKAASAALKIYALNHPKAPLKSFDREALVKDKAFPPALDLSAFPPLKWDGETVSMEGFGSLSELQDKLKDYEAGLEKAIQFRQKGLRAEWYLALKKLATQFPKDPSLMDRLLRTQIELGLNFEGTQTAKALFLARPNDPRNLYLLALLYYRSSRPELASQIAVVLPRLYPTTFYTAAATNLVGLVGSRVSASKMQTILDEKDALKAREDADEARARQAVQQSLGSVAPAPPPKPEPEPSASAGP